MSFDYTKIESIISKEKIKYNEEMKKHTTIRIGGLADVLVLPTSVEDVINIVKFVKENNIPFNIIGNGSKLLVLDSGIRGVVLKIGNNMSEYKIDSEYIIAEAGIMVPKLAIVARQAGLSGLEFAAGIPGCLGGCVWMNAGAYDGDMASVVEETVYLNKDLEVKTLKGSEHKFAYRESIFNMHESEKNVILSVKLKFEFKSVEEIALKMKENNDSRKLKQPLEYPSAGSTFKRPEGYFVGKLIDDAGLKGKIIGGAQISNKHSGFIVNRENASAKDVIDLIVLTKKEVKKQFNVDLEPEIMVIGGKT